MPLGETQAAEPDHPGVIAFPPVILASALAVSGLLGFILPMSILPPPLAGPSLVTGGVAVLAAGVIAISGILAFRRAGTNIEPHKPALVLVEDGPYRFTRNPMYLGLLLLHLAISLLGSMDWGLFVFPLFWLTLHHGVVLREERYLAAKFGEPYAAYLDRTRRWV
ncbi:MAG: isoprenylcysteine carboxylmethyltransferase family protein [Pseudomonadota bacterium]